MGKGLVKPLGSLTSVAGLPVLDGALDEVVRAAAVPAKGRARLVYALHVGGLLHRDDAEFCDALRGADLVYADGAAVVLLAKAAGADRIERAATTDIGIPIIEALATKLGRRVRTALIGGRPGLAQAAAQRLEDIAPVDAVLVAHGYFNDDTEMLRELDLAAPDLVIVGLGMPYEAKWTYRHREDLPSAVILTCGGWFGFLVGEERRAPSFLQHVGLEWTYRLMQDFPRLSGRYGRGVLAVLRLLPGQFRLRREDR